MVDREESILNLEIVSALVIAVGMICLMINELLSILLLLAGAGSLALIYGYRIVAGRKENYGKRLFIWIYRLNYLTLLLSIGMLAWLILSHERRMAWLAAGIGILALTLGVDLLTCREKNYRERLITCGVRVGLSMMLILLFYFFPIR